MKDKMNCKMFEARLNDYLDNELDMASQAAFLEHSRQCPQCEKTLRTAKAIMNECALLDAEIRIPLDAQASWRRAIRQEAAGKNKRQKSRLNSWVKGLGTVAAAVALFIGGAFAVQNMGSLSSAIPNLVANNSMEYASEDYSYDYAADGGMGYVASEPEVGIAGGGSYAKTISTSNRPMVLDIDGPVADEAPTASPIEIDESQSTGASEAGEKMPANPMDLLPTPTDAPTGADPEVKKTDIMVVRSASRSIESINYDDDYKYVQELVSEYEGLTESVSSYGSKLEPGKTRGRTAYFYVRIPTGQLDDFLKMLDDVGTITSRSENAQDISMQYYDVKTRLDNQKAFRTKLQQMVTQAATVEEMIAVEEKLSSVQAEIDSMEGTIRGWDSQVNYSGVNIDVNEVADRAAVQKIDSVSLMDRVKTGFFDAINGFMEFAQNLLVWLVTVWPWLVVLALVLIIAGPIIKRRRRR